MRLNNGALIPRSDSLERRRSPRRVVRLPARFRIGFRPETGGDWLPCVIHDISAAGACLQLPDFPVLPDDIVLGIGGVAAPIPCRLVWTANGIAGFRFVASGD